MKLYQFKLSPILIRLLTSPLTLAFVLTLIAIPFINFYFPRYSAKITNSGFVEKPGGLISYFDIDNDGRSEQLILFINHQGKPTYKVTDQNGLVVDQHEYEGDAFPDKCQLIFSDIDHNGNTEVSAFIQKGDSLFLDILEYSQYFIQRPLSHQFITLVRNWEGRSNYYIARTLITDVDQDSIEDFVFTVCAGYPIFPRSFFICKPLQDKVIQSPFMGGLVTVSSIVDLDHDGRKEILVDEYSPGNMVDTTIGGLDDNSVRFRVLNDKLQDRFKPLEFSGKYSNLNCMPITSEGKQYVAVLYCHRGVPKNFPKLVLFDLEGRKVKEAILDTNKVLTTYNFLAVDPMERMIYLKDIHGRRLTYDMNLKLIRTEASEYGTYDIRDELDMDGDDKPESILLANSEQKLIVQKQNFSYPVMLDLVHENQFTNLSFKHNVGVPNELFLQFTQKYYLVSYSRNAYYYFKYLTYAIFFILISGFIYFVQWLQHYRMREKFRNQRNLTALQLKLVKKQVDPHFLFNVITTLSYNLLNKESDEAYAGISRLAKFMRSAVEWGDKIARPLKEELEVVRTYLELYGKQHPGKFDFSIETDDTVDLDQQVPVMILLNFVENSIKHGISARGGNGKINIHIQSNLKATQCRIEDNGIGRNASREAGTSGTGKGLGLMQQYLELLNRYNDQKVVFEIEDLIDKEGEPSGTRVNLIMPIGIKYFIYEE